MIGVPSPVIARRLATALLACLSLACADRTSLPDNEVDTEGPAPGEPFSDCIDKGDCDDDWCVHPAGEPGFCTYACGSGGPQGCEPAYAGTATATCLPVEGEQVCALDCSGNKVCPADMRCEQIEAAGQPRSICF